MLGADVADNDEANVGLVSGEDYLRLVRFDILPEEFLEKYSPVELVLEDFIPPTLEDLITAAERFIQFARNGGRQILKDWQGIVRVGGVDESQPAMRSMAQWTLGTAWPVGEESQKAEEGSFESLSETETVNGLWHVIQFAWVYELVSSEYVLKQFEENLQRGLFALEGRGKPYAERHYTVGQMQAFIQKWSNQDVKKENDPELIDLYVRFVNELVEADNTVGLKEKAYACYNPDSVGFGQNWAQAFKCFERLMELNPISEYMEKLGEICCSRKANNGMPKYDKAFQYFSISAATGSVESLYKMGEMLIAGQGVPKNHSVGIELISKSYSKWREAIPRGEYDLKIADVAFRLGELCEQRGRLNAAYGYYLESREVILPFLGVRGASHAKELRDQTVQALARVFPQTRFCQINELIAAKGEVSEQQAQEINFEKHATIQRLLGDINSRYYDMECWIEEPQAAESKSYLTIRLPYPYFKGIGELSMAVNTAIFEFDITNLVWLRVPESLNKELVKTGILHLREFDSLLFENRWEIEGRDPCAALEAATQGVLEDDYWVLSLFESERDDEALIVIAGKFELVAPSV